MIRIGFLLNHDAAHQVMHCIPTAFELARRHPEIAVVIINTTSAEAKAVAGIAADYPDPSCQIEIAEPPVYASLFDTVTGHALLAKWFGVLWRHRALTQSDPVRYRAEQERAFAEAFDLTDTPSAIRAADAITGFLANEEWPRPGRL